ncbi:MAG: AraC family transcriptional regulator [Lachnospiraceae bacterium]|nr:AraC family transcriptional regulator [Lachnospiraceae bacterium]
MYRVTKKRIVPSGRGFSDLHWHEELQFTLVTRGEMTMQVDGVGYDLKAGEAIFINRNFLHEATRLEHDGEYVSFNFPERLLFFFPGSLMEQQDVLPYTGGYAFSAIVLGDTEPWQREIRARLQQLEMLCTQRQEGRAESANHLEYRISLEIAGIWYLMLGHFPGDSYTPSRIAIRRQERIQKMITFIRDNYMKHVELADIAASANVSIGECCRCFQKMVRATPNQYLMRWRIDRAMELLDRTEETITDIGMRVGFSDASYFIRCFRKRTGMTPKEYRDKNC